MFIHLLWATLKGIVAHMFETTSVQNELVFEPRPIGDAEEIFF